MRFFIIPALAFAAMVTTFSRDASAQLNPCEPSNMAAMTVPYEKLRWATECLMLQKGMLIANSAELEKNLEGGRLEEFRGYFRILIDLYGKFKNACEKNTGEFSEEYCWKFKTAFLGNPILKNDVFTAALLQGDQSIIRSWVDAGMPFQDPNRMNADFDLRFTVAQQTNAETVAMEKAGSTLQILQTLVESGVIHKNSDESYPLHAAIAGGNADRARYLMAKGWDVNAVAYKPVERYLDEEELKTVQQRRGTTPLIAAIINESAESFEDLMAHPQIDVNAPQLLFGMSPLMIAADGAMITNSKKDLYYKTLLNDKRTDINFSTPEGYTVLNTLISSYKEIGNPKLAIHVKKLLKDRRFDITKHCGPTQPCLMSLTFDTSLTKLPVNSEIFKKLKPLVQETDSKSTAYFIKETKNEKGEKVEKITGLTFDEFLARRIEMDPKNASELTKIRALAAKWQKK